MAKKAFERIMAGLEDALAIAKGDADPSSYRIHVPVEIDVKAIRAKTGLTQVQFAKRYGFPPSCIRDWEQGRSNPSGALRAYLAVIDHDRAAVEKALQAA